MDFIDVLFNKQKPFTPISAPGGTTNGSVVQTHRKLFVPRLHISQTQDMENDMEMTRQNFKQNLKLNCQAQDNNEASEHCEDEVFTKYDFNDRKPNARDLPVYQFKDAILSNIAKYPAIVIEGSTGCGKSTQIPQMILDDAKANKKPCSIVVTQPRRIAARSIAERVSNERGWELGTIVGYQIGLDRHHKSEDTRMIFCTTGVLLEKLIKKKTLAGYTHIILDEVHERDKDMDFLFIIIRMLQVKEGSNVKIILMSATIDGNMFAKYFGYYKDDHFEPAPVIQMDKQNLYTVRKYYLDDLNSLHLPDIDWQQPGISDEMYELASKLICQMDKIDERDGVLYPSVLVFLPGIYEIGRLRNALTNYEKKNWRIFILHSLISTEEQQSIFQPVEEGIRKIILSTNIAESSITVPDVKYVIDFCLMKYLRSDSSKNFTTLEMDWASKNNCRQRAGRAGRLSNGRCYRLVPVGWFNYHMREAPIPELLLTPLENVILRAKTFEMGAPHEILGLAMEDSRPQLNDIVNTILRLKELGALLLTHNDQGYTPNDGDLTFLGRIMANLPLDIRASRLIAIGFCYGVLEESIIMAAGLSTKSIFRISFDRDLKEYTRRLEWSNGSGSDLFAILNAYRIWTLKYNTQEFGKEQAQRTAERDFCNRHFLDVRSLHECHQLVQELTKRLDKLGIRQFTGSERVNWTDQEKTIVLKMIIGGAFYPNFFATAPINNPMIERDVFHVMNGRDPNNTIYFTGFRTDFIRELYVDSIRNLFKDTVVKKEDLNTIKVSFDSNSEKVFVTFDSHTNVGDAVRTDWETRNSSVPGKAITEVYKAVKMGKIRMPTRIGVMKTDREKVVAEELGIGIMTGSTFLLKEKVRDDVDNMCIPNALFKEVRGFVTHIEDCSKFWFRPRAEQRRFETFQKDLNENAIDMIEGCTDLITIPRDKIFVARDGDGTLYRARLVALDEDMKSATVSLIDIGRTLKCLPSHVYMFKQDNELSSLPPRCFQCRLAEIQPSTANISGGYMWDSDAIELFKFFADDCEVKAEVYSVVNGTVNVIISANGVNFNEKLISKGFGELCEENYLSKTNHWQRQEFQNETALNGASNENVVKFHNTDEYYPIDYADPIDVDVCHCSKIVQLKGPNSPLETTVHSVLSDNNQSSISIDAHSVNSVFLTPMQQDLSIKYLVAAHICKHGGFGTGFTIQETTLLPNIRGFGALVAMLFSPSMDLKRDKWKSRYVSVRTGLGYNDEEQRPYFVEHDAVFPLDFELTEEDVTCINQMRYSMNTLFYTFTNNHHNDRSDTVSDENTLQVMKKLKDLTMQLLTAKRKPMEVNVVTHEWKEYNPAEYKLPTDFHHGKHVFPPHGLVQLEIVDENVKKQLKQHCAELRKMAESMPRPIMCKLCSTDIENVAMMRIHLITRLHLEREKQVGYLH